jgi:hypothetical protein
MNECWGAGKALFGDRLRFFEQKALQNQGNLQENFERSEPN